MKHICEVFPDSSCPCNRGVRTEMREVLDRQEALSALVAKAAANVPEPSQAWFWLGIAGLVFLMAMSVLVVFAMVAVIISWQWFVLWIVGTSGLSGAAMYMGALKDQQYRRAVRKAVAPYQGAMRRIEAEYDLLKRRLRYY